MQPTQEKMFRTKLFSAIPAEDFLGINSVSMVADMPKMIIDPMPKTKLAIIFSYVSLDPSVNSNLIEKR